MGVWKVARRYAQALFAYAREKGVAEGVYADMALLRASVAGSRELSLTLRNPVLPPSAKEKAVAAVFKGRVGPAMGTFFTFLAKKRRLDILGEIADAYDQLEKERQGVVEGVLSTARPVTDARRNDLEKGLSKKHGLTYRLAPEVRPELLGGFRLKVRDRVFDCSLENQLQRLREKLVGEG